LPQVSADTEAVAKSSSILRAYVKYLPYFSTEILVGTELEAGRCTMQFTGFYDKNGKQVFEGDIVKAMRAQRRGRTIVGYEEMYFEVVFDAEAASFRFGSNALGWSALSDVASIYEVIGNKSEKPDLVRLISPVGDRLQTVQ
jgi:hypothetical protein